MGKIDGVELQHCRELMFRRYEIEKLFFQSIDSTIKTQREYELVIEFKNEYSTLYLKCLRSLKNKSASVVVDNVEQCKRNLENVIRKYDAKIFRSHKSTEFIVDIMKQSMKLKFEVDERIIELGGNIPVVGVYKDSQEQVHSILMNGNWIWYDKNLREGDIVPAGEFLSTQLLVGNTDVKTKAVKMSRKIRAFENSILKHKEA